MFRFISHCFSASPSISISQLLFTVLYFILFCTNEILLWRIIFPCLYPCCLRSRYYFNVCVCVWMRLIFFFVSLPFFMIIAIIQFSDVCWCTTISFICNWNIYVLRSIEHMRFVSAIDSLCFQVFFLFPSLGFAWIKRDCSCSVR